MRTDHGILQAQLYRRFIFEFGDSLQSRLYHGAALRDGAQAAHRLSVSGLHPREGDSRGGSLSDTADRVSCGPYECESGDGHSRGASSDCAQQASKKYLKTHASDSERHCGK